VREPGERQKAKSLRMHQLIVRAVVICLDRYGYAETSINRVLEHAAVSRGALQHQFENKEELIAATAERLMQRSLDIISVPRIRSRRTLRDELLTLWRTLIHTREYRALLEILNAVRTDRRLRKRILPILRTWDAAIDQQMIELYVSASGADKDVIEIMTMSRCLLRGLVIQESFANDPAAIESIIERWRDMLGLNLQLREQTPRVAS
jgi:AcrR family transcriptional regulator